MNNPRVGLVGLGNMGKNHARVLDGLQGIDFIGIFDQEVTSGFYGRNRIHFSSLSDLLSQDLDYVVVATPTVSHESIALSAIERGISVLLEKPISVDLASAKRISEEAQKNNIFIGVGHIERYNSAAIALRKKIMDNFLGNIHQVSTRRLGPRPLRISDVGVVKDLATHDVDLVTWVLNSKFSQIYARTLKLNNSTHEDHLLLLGELDSGVIVSNTVNWCTPRKERKILITGDRGLLVADLLKSELTFFQNGTAAITQDTLAHFTGGTTGEIVNYSFNKPEPLLLEHESFRDQFLGCGSSAVLIEDALHTMEVTDAILRSGKLNTIETFI